MCRSDSEGGRRCPGGTTPEHRALVNQSRRERYSEKKKSSGGAVRSYQQRTYPVVMGSQISAQFQTRLDKEWDESFYTPIRNWSDADSAGLPNKPRGGLWLSPLLDNGKSAWDDFMYYESGEEAIQELKTGHHYDANLRPEAKIMVINSKEDYFQAIRMFPSEVEELDFKSMGVVKKASLDYQKISSTFDAIYIKQGALNAFGWQYQYEPESSTTVGLYGWDIPSLVVFNPNILEISIVDDGSNTPKNGDNI